MPFELRALELHGQHIWRRDSILRALEIIREYGLTALVLHETDMVQMVTYPRSDLDPHGLWQSAPTRRGENAIENNRVYLRHVLALARRAGVAVYLETKEIGFPDEILALHPELIKDGVICPSEPFWFDFIERKTAELFADFPALAGMISSAGSTEGKVSRAQNKCGCALCQAMSLEDWYGRIIGALHRAAGQHGKRLAVRDFAYKPEDHAPLIRAVERAPRDVIFCAKVTPHDFYPTFPHNPAIRIMERPLWIEYDTMGQFYGWGLFPSLMTDDLRDRLAHAERAGASGVSFRVEWERINDYWSLDAPNLMNLIAGAALAQGEAVDAETVCRTWLRASGWPEAAAPFLAGLLARSWDVMRGALFMDGFVFADNSMYPRGLWRAWWGMEVRDALHTWDPSRSGDLRLTRSRIARLLEEKQEAVDAATKLMVEIRNGDAVLPPALHELLVATFARTETYVRGFALCAAVCLSARWCDRDLRDDEGPGPLDLERFAAELNALDAFGAALRSLEEEGRVPHQLVMLLDHRRIADIAREGRAVLAAQFEAA